MAKAGLPADARHLSDGSTHLGVPASPESEASTSLTDLSPAVDALPRPEKGRLLAYLAGELADRADDPTLDPAAVYPVWTPYDGHEAADVLLGLYKRGNAAP